MTDRFTHGYGEDRRKGKRGGTLWYSLAIGEGDVTINMDLDEYNSLTRLDLLQDWIGLLQREYNLTLEQFQKEMKVFANGK